ncbi:MAG: PIN domain-containing protein [Patescibacteria group bacterium]
MGISSIFLDSSYLIAYFNTNDALHTQACEIGKILKPEINPLIISNYIFLEITTVLSQKAGRHLARTVGEYILSTSSIRCIHIDPSLHHKTWTLFQTIGQKDIGFVDCSIIAAMKAEGITTLLTFDTHFKKLQKHHRFSLYA